MKRKHGITNKGIGWELANSIWMAAAFVVFLNWAAFLYIGIRTKQRKWKMWSVFYLVILIIYGVMNEVGSPSAASIALDIYMVSWIMSIIHVFLARKEFLIRLEVLKDGNVRQQENDQLRQRIQQEYVRKSEPEESIHLAQSSKTVSQSQEKQAENSFNQTENHSEKTELRQQEESRQIQQEQIHSEVSGKILDVNHCTAEELAELPGITIVMAQKAITHREESGRFLNVEDFLEFIALKPHFVVQVRDRLTCTSESDQFDHKTENTGRILDF